MNACMKFYKEKEPLNLETDASGVGLRAGPLHLPDWLSQQKNKDKEIPGIKLSIKAIETYMDILDCMSSYEIHDWTKNDEHLQVLTTYITDAWSLTAAEVKKATQQYWAFHDTLAVIGRILMKIKE